MKKFLRWSPFFVLIVLLSFLVASKLIAQSVNATGSAQSRGAGEGQPVRALTVTSEPFSLEREFTGTLVAREGVDIRPEISGKVVEIAFEEGSFVNRGELLVRLNDSELQAELEAANQNLRLAKLQAQRQARLVDTGSTSREAFDEARIREASLQALVHLIEARLEKTRILAPFSGLIGLRDVSLGSVIDSSDVITSLQSIDELKVDFAIPERHVPLIQMGMPVSLQIEGYADPFPGKLSATSPKIDRDTRTLLCRAVVNNEKRQLLPGSFARVTIALRNFPDAILLPSTALIPSLEGQSIFVVEDNKAVPRKISIELRTPDRVLVRSGVDIGEQVVVLGVQGLRPNASVQLIQ